MFIGNLFLFRIYILLLVYISNITSTLLKTTGVGCGIKPISSIDNARMIVNGSEVTPHSIPWQVLVRVQTISGKMRRCGGTLLTARHVLTAAHCIIGPVHVVVEEHDLDSEKDGLD